MDKHIRIEALKDGWLYKIEGRNANLGVWAADKHCFFISRSKFGENFLSMEFHCDDDPPYGTAKPLNEVERVPFWGVYVAEDVMLAYLNSEESAVSSWVWKEDLAIEDTPFGSVYALCPDKQGEIYFGRKKESKK